VDCDVTIKQLELSDTVCSRLRGR